MAIEEKAHETDFIVHGYAGALSGSPSKEQ
jgi:hypothetical protein